MSLLGWLWRRVRAKRPEGQSCGNCIHFVDMANPAEPDEDDDIQKCAYLIDTLGFDEALRIDPYGGPWTTRGSWCEQWEGGDPIWQRDDAVSREGTPQP